MFNTDPDDIEWSWLRQFIMNQTGKRFREWKCRCHKHFDKYGPDLPYEFKDRPQQWEWLCNHFTTPEFQVLKCSLIYQHYLPF